MAFINLLKFLNIFRPVRYVSYGYISVSHKRRCWRSLQEQLLDLGTVAAAVPKSAGACPHLWLLVSQQDKCQPIWVQGQCPCVGRMLVGFCHPLLKKKSFTELWSENKVELMMEINNNTQTGTQNFFEKFLFSAYMWMLLFFQFYSTFIRKMNRNRHHWLLGPCFFLKKHSLMFNNTG